MKSVLTIATAIACIGLSAPAQSAVDANLWTVQLIPVDDVTNASSDASSFDEQSAIRHGAITRAVRLGDGDTIVDGKTFVYVGGFDDNGNPTAERFHAGIVMAVKAGVNPTLRVSFTTLTGTIATEAGVDRGMILPTTREASIESTLPNVHMGHDFFTAGYIRSDGRKGYQVRVRRGAPS